MYNYNGQQLPIACHRGGRMYQLIAYLPFGAEPFICLDHLGWVHQFDKVVINGRDRC
jgi:hypothetical protein